MTTRVDDSKSVMLLLASRLDDVEKTMRRDIGHYRAAARGRVAFGRKEHYRVRYVMAAWQYRAAVRLLNPKEPT